MIALYHDDAAPQSAQLWLVCNKGVTQFYLPPTHKPYLPLLPSLKASSPLGRYQLVLLGEQRNLPRVFPPQSRRWRSSVTFIRVVPWVIDWLIDWQVNCCWWFSGVEHTMLSISLRLVDNYKRCWMYTCLTESAACTNVLTYLLQKSYCTVLCYGIYCMLQCQYLNSDCLATGCDGLHSTEKNAEYKVSLCFDDSSFLWDGEVISEVLQSCQTPRHWKQRDVLHC